MIKPIHIICALTLVGCGAKSPYDISSGDAEKHRLILTKSGNGELPPPPPGSSKHEQIFKKGDRLPDGSIAPGDVHLITIEKKKPL